MFPCQCACFIIARRSHSPIDDETETLPHLHNLRYIARQARDNNHKRRRVRRRRRHSNLSKSVPNIFLPHPQHSASVIASSYERCATPSIHPSIHPSTHPSIHPVPIFKGLGREDITSAARCLSTPRSNRFSPV